MAKKIILKYLKLKILDGVWDPGKTNGWVVPPT